MATRKRTPVEDAMAKVLDTLKENIPATVGGIADEIGLSWEVVNRAVSLMVNFQDFSEAYRVEVLGGKGRKIVLLELRVDLTLLPDDVREWFIEERFFKTEEKKRYPTEIASEMIPKDRGTNDRTTLEETLHRLTQALLLEDELSVLELSKRTDLNRRTIERALKIILQVQDELFVFGLNVIDGSVIKRKNPIVYDLDTTRMKILLKYRYLPHLIRNEDREKEQYLLRGV